LGGVVGQGGIPAGNGHRPPLADDRDHEIIAGAGKPELVMGRIAAAQMTVFNLGTKALLM
jgi:hypothetical protein